MKIPKLPFVPQAGTDRASLKHTIKRVIDSNGESTDPFFVVDLGDVFRKFQKWQRMLPRVEPFYAVKCCPEPKILEALATLGVNFDCASKGEIEQVLKLGVAPNRIIFAHPAKAIPHVKYARDAGVDLMTFDNEYELIKIRDHFPAAKLVLRILADDPNAVCNLGNKFGAHPDSTLNLLNIAQTLGLNVVGVSFHVGSGCQNPQAFEYAIASARRVFDEGRSVGYQFSILDIGGGFPGSESATVNFRDIANVLNGALDRYFSSEPDVHIIAEPGRYFAASACTLVLNVIAKKAARTEVPSFMYYVNDGLYGALNCCLYDHQVVTVKAIKEDQFSENLSKSSVWGPTCDGIDCITRDAILPELEAGDWVYIEDAGAYTLAAMSSFNGFERPTNVYTFSAVEKFDDSILPEAFPVRPHLPCTLMNRA